MSKTFGWQRAPAVLIIMVLLSGAFTFNGSDGHDHGYDHRSDHDGHGHGDTCDHTPHPDNAEAPSTFNILRDGLDPGLTSDCAEMNGNRNDVGRSYETDPLGGRWYQSSDEDFNHSRMNGTVIEGSGSAACIILSQGNETGNITSGVIELPPGMFWDRAAFDAFERNDTSVSMSVLHHENDSALVRTINISSSVDISSLNELNIEKLRLRMDLNGNGTDTPYLWSWGVEWTAKDTWRDSFMAPRTTTNTSAELDGYATVNEFNLTAVIISEEIPLPENHTWSNLHADCTVPANTELNISVLDASTGLELLGSSHEDGSIDIDIDLTGLDASVHTAVKLRTCLVSNVTKKPVLLSWAVSWSPIEMPLYVNTIEDVDINEDSPEYSILNLSAYFEDRYRSLRPSNYSVVNASDDTNININPNTNTNITITINGSILGVSYLAANWTGYVELTVACTNAYGRTACSDPFRISVLGVEDAPVWLSPPPDIRIKEDSAYTGNYSLLEFAMDADGDELIFSVVCSEEFLNVEIDANESIMVVPADNLHGTARLNITVTEKTPARLSANVSITVLVEAVDDPPSVSSVFPENGMTVTGPDVLLVWESSDIDGPVTNDIEYDIHIGTDTDPPPYACAVKGTSRSFKGLVAGATYYWYVVPSSPTNEENARPAPYRFIVNRSVDIPRVVLVSPLNNTIINRSEQEIRWELSGETSRTINYLVFAGPTLNDMELKNETSNAKCRLDGLENGLEYYWKVIPVSDSVAGVCSGGFRKMTYLRNFTGIYDMTAFLDMKEINMYPGGNASFNLTIRNSGTMPLIARITLGGSMARYVTIERKIELAVGAILTVPACISLGAAEFPRMYNLTILVCHPGGEKELILTIVIRETDEKTSTPVGPQRREFHISPFWMVMNALALLILIVMITLLVRKRRKQRTDTVDKDTEDGQVERKGGNVYFVGGEHRKERFDEPLSNRGIDVEIYSRDVLGGEVPPRPPSWLSSGTGNENETAEHTMSAFADGGVGEHDRANGKGEVGDGAYVGVNGKGEGDDAAFIGANEMETANDPCHDTTHRASEHARSAFVPRPPRIGRSIERGSDEVDHRAKEDHRTEDIGTDWPAPGGSSPGKTSAVYDFLSPELFWGEKGKNRR